MSMTKKFYQMTLPERWQTLEETSGLDTVQIAAINGEAGLRLEQANHMIENVIGLYALPLGVAQHFVINGIERLVPMVIEEPSVVAAASYMAKLVKAGGGFTAQTTPPEMIGQIQLLDLGDPASAKAAILAEKESLLSLTAEIDPILTKLGGGPHDLLVRELHSETLGDFLVIHLIYDVRDAMGANAINTALERLSPRIETISGGRAHLRILSNLADRRLARATCRIPLEKLAFNNFSAETVRDGIIEAWAFAEADPYRAATHNKGIMNGIDAVVLATGNDWRAVEAGAHAYAARSGHYTSLSHWWQDEKGDLCGELELPMAVGTVGGATRVHPTAQAALALLGVKSAQELAEVIVSVGLAQNLAAIRALATEGIQRGHMGLHARQVAIAAGASEEQIDSLAAQLVQEKNVRIDRAKEIMNEWKEV
ncbi:MAG: hydroxymethylglutaryl-CoA reductase, degradative [Anaerolineaceae bacterium]|nr:hydroxymethylglutaryl-CoA reductase, degradative [Anaerolineaceae bacterium]